MIEDPTTRCRPAHDLHPRVVRLPEVMSVRWCTSGIPPHDIYGPCHRAMRNALGWQDRGLRHRVVVFDHGAGGSRLRSQKGIDTMRI